MSNETKVVVLMLIGITLFKGLETKKSMVLYFNRADVSFNPLYLQNHSLALKNTTMDVVLNVAKEFPHDPWAVITLTKKDRKSKIYRTLLQYDVNICSVLGRDSDNFLSMWVQNFLKYGNLPKSCPILKGNYSWCDLKVDKLSIPDFLPSAQYKAQVETYFRKDTAREFVANLTVFAALK